MADFNEIKNRLKFDRTPLQIIAAVVVMIIYYAIGLCAKDVAYLYTTPEETSSQEVKKDDPAPQKEKAAEEKKTETKKAE